MVMMTYWQPWWWWLWWRWWRPIGCKGEIGTFRRPKHSSARPHRNYNRIISTVMMMMAIMMMTGDDSDDFDHPLGLNIWLWCSRPPTLPMCYAKQLKSLVEFQEFQALQTTAEQLHSADQAAIVAVTRLMCWSVWRGTISIEWWEEWKSIDWNWPHILWMTAIVQDL